MFELLIIRICLWQNVYVCECVFLNYYQVKIFKYKYSAGT
jgi:hypothetical protein